MRAMPPCDTERLCILGTELDVVWRRCARFPVSPLSTVPGAPGADVQTDGGGNGGPELSTGEYGLCSGST